MTGIDMARHTATVHPTRQLVVDEARGVARNTVVRLRTPLHRFRSLPSFLIIGTQRGGTTSLFHYLGEHPDVGSSLGKEIQFFSLHWHKGIAWYRSHFPYRRSLEAGPHPKQTFEASPYYLFHPLAARRAADVVPDARIVVLLRDPVERAHSHYLHNRRLGFEPLAFEDALAAEPARLAGEEERLLADDRYRSARHRRFSYVARGRYASQLRPWLERFGDRVLVLRSEDLYADPATIFAELQTFLGLRSHTSREFRQYTKRTVQQGGMRDRTRAGLRVAFEESNRELAALVGRDFEWDR